MKLLSPVTKDIPISQCYGPSDLMMYGQYVYADRFHYGNDFACITGTPIRASMSGTVIYAKYNDGFGKNIIIEKDGYQSRVAHLSVIDVTVGQHVEVGQYIGLSGNSGIWTNGSHCHWDMKKDGVYFDGLKFMTYNLEEIRMITKEDADRCCWAILRHAPDQEFYRHYVESGEFQGSIVDMWADVADSQEHTKLYNDAMLWRNQLNPPPTQNNTAVYTLIDYPVYKKTK